MFHITSGRKSRLDRAVVLCTLLLLLCSFALPTSASPADLSFTFDVTYSPISTGNGSGSWSSAGRG